MRPSARSPDRRAFDLLGLAHVGRNGEAVLPELGLHVLERLRTAAADRHLAPVRASSRATARPIPVPPPVTSATLPAFASEQEENGTRSRHQASVGSPPLERLAH